MSATRLPEVCEDPPIVPARPSALEKYVTRHFFVSVSMFFFSLKGVPKDCMTQFDTCSSVPPEEQRNVVDPQRLVQHLLLLPTDPPMRYSHQQPCTGSLAGPLAMRRQAQGCPALQRARVATGQQALDGGVRAVAKQNM